MTRSGTTTISPELTALDHMALRGLPDSAHPGIRDWQLADPRNWNFQEEAALTLRGLQHLGYADQTNGWWKRTAAGDAYLDHIDAPPAHQETLA